jgi:hypothetical protein
MPIAVGGTNITDIKIGSTVINSVWVGGTQVWSRLSLSTSPANGSSTAYSSNGNASAQVNVLTSPSTNVSWTFTVNSQSGSGTLSYGASSGTSTFVRLFQTYNAPQSQSSLANVTVNAVVGGTVVASTVCSLSANTIFINEGGG